MSDLSEFGGGIERDEPEQDTDDASEPEVNYRSGRCPALSTSKSPPGRCRSPVSEMSPGCDFCGVHARKRDPWTIHDDPEVLIILTGELDTLDLFAVDPDTVRFDLERVQEALIELGYRDPISAAIARLDAGAKFRVDCHDEVLRIDRDASHFGGNTLAVAFDEDAAKYVIEETDDGVFMGRTEQRRKQITDVEVVES